MTRPASARSGTSRSSAVTDTPMRFRRLAALRGESRTRRSMSATLSSTYTENPWWNGRPCWEVAAVVHFAVLGSK